MTGPGHHATGFITGVMATSICFKVLGLPLLVSLASLPLSVVGGLFPDSGEKLMGVRIVRHRTVTHWLPLWLAGALAALFFPPLGLPGDAVQSCLLGFTLGGLTHLLFDWPNPLGIPILTPYRRHSLKLWNSGRREGLIVLAWAGLSCLFWLPELGALVA